MNKASGVIEQSEVTGFEIAIIGMAGRFPGAADLDAFWSNLQNGVESASRFSREELAGSGVAESVLEDPSYVPVRGVLQGAEEFDAGFFGYYPREAQMLDPQHRVFLECVWEALEDACIIVSDNTGPVGLFAGAGINAYGIHAASDPYLATAADNYQLHFANSPHLLAPRVSYKLNLRGPSLTVLTACSTSLAAIHLACQSLWQGESAIAIAGGVKVAFPQKTGHIYVPGGALSPDGCCRVFDADAQGTFGADGVGVVVLKRLDDAIAAADHIRAVIKGSAMNNDGNDKIGFAAPSIKGQAEVIRTALTVAAVDPRTVGYVEAHGTGTPLGDPIEVAALSQAFGTDPEHRGYCALGSVKSNIGHTDAAAGVAGLIKAVLALENGGIPPSLHFRQPNPEMKIDDGPFYVNAALRQWPDAGHPRRAGVSSFGIGGTNVHIILEEAPRPSATTDPTPWKLLTLSAKTQSALDTLTRKLESHLASHPAQDLADVAYTLHVGRTAFAHRRVVVCQNASDPLARLRDHDPEMFKTAVASFKPDTPIAFLFPGGGTQYAEMGRGLYESEPVFGNALDTCADLLMQHLAYDIRALLYPGSPIAREASNKRLNEPVPMAASLFSVSYALAQLWASWGVLPDALIGHSLGEYVAACVSGVFALDDALRLVTRRSQLIETLPLGVMLAVKLPEEQLLTLLPESVSIAAVNNPGTCVVSGPLGPIEKLEDRLNRESIWFRRLSVKAAGHSAAIEPIIESFAEELNKVVLRPPKTRFVSCLSGTWITPELATSPDYWLSHLRGTVRFGAGIEKLLEDDARILLEVGPGHTLTTLACCSNKRRTTHVAIPSLRHPNDPIDDRAYLLSSLGRMWLTGVEVDWASFHSRERRERVSLPTYPFERQRYTVRTNVSAYPAPRLDTGCDTRMKNTEIPVNSSSANLMEPGNELTRAHAATEQQLTTMWEALFGLFPINRDDNFFKLGGHSFLATRLVFLIEKQWDVKLSVRSLFDAPTIAELAQVIDMAAAGEAIRQPDLREMIEDAALPPDVVPAAPENAGDDSPSGAVLLIGATGYLGGYLLCELIKQSSATIFCLVRPRDEADAWNRIRDNLAAYDLWEDSFSSRIVPLSGDMGQARFGLGARLYDELARRVSAVYNCGAQVHFTYPYSVLKAANVNGTREVVSFACRGRRKAIHHVSTLAVFPLTNSGEREIFEHSETGPVESLLTAYAQSKWVAEQVINSARRAGVEAAIYRAGAVLGDTRNARCRPGDFVWRMLKGAIQLGKAPDMVSALPASPADYASGAIVRLSLDSSSRGKNFHVIGPEPLRWSDIFEAARHEGFALETVPYSQWYAELFRQARQDETGALFPIIHQIDYERFKHTRFKCSDTERALGEWPGPAANIGPHLLRRYVQNFIRSGFLTPPPFGSREKEPNKLLSQSTTSN